MKVYCTYESAGSLYAGGLERVRVWFSRPVYSFVKKDDKDVFDSLPFGGGTELQGFKKLGWTYNNYERGDKASFSFGKVFGYSDANDEFPEIAEYIWGKLQDHFGKKSLSDWMEAEKNGVKSCDFLLEIDLDIKLNL